jgi:hypothetical protein
MVFVGKIRSVKLGTGMVVYEMEDDTGTVRLVGLCGDDKPQFPDIPVGCYAKVFCAPYVFSATKSCTVSQIFQIGYEDKVVRTRYRSTLFLFLLFTILTFSHLAGVCTDYYTNVCKPILNMD